MQGFASQQHRAPLIAKLRSQSLVQRNGFLVPVKHFPVYPVAALVHCYARDFCQQGPPDSLPAKLLPHKKIFQKQSAANPRREVIEKQCVTSGFSLPLANEGTESGMLAEPIAREVLFADRYPLKFLLVLCKFTNHGSQQGSVMDGGWTNSDHRWPDSLTILLCKLPKRSAERSVLRAVPAAKL